jgi:Leucine-rich repeat (LRR) protein
MLNLFCCVRGYRENSEEPEITSSNPNQVNSEEPQPTPRNLADLIDAWISEQPVGNEANLNIAKARILQAHSERSARLDLTTLNLSTFPPLEKLAPHLAILNLGNNKLEGLPESIGDFQMLRELSLRQNQISSLPDSIGDLLALTHLTLHNNRISSLPDSIGNLQRLVSLDICENQLSSLPDRIGELQELSNLILNQNQISSLPNTIGDLANLRVLFLDQNQISSLPDRIGDLQELEHLTLNQNQISSLPDSIERLQTLVTLHINENNITYQQLPTAVSDRHKSGFIKINIDFLTIIKNNANFTAEEKSQIATQALAIDYLKINNCDQDLQSNLVEIRDFLKRQDGERNMEPLTEFLTRLVLEDGSYERADAESQKLLSRQILEVLLIVNDKKDDKEFIKGALGVCQVGQVSCGDRTALYFYYLKNFVNGKTAPELDSMFQQFHQEDSKSDEVRPSQSQAPEDLDPEKLIESLKNQATFNYILKMAESKCKEIKEANPSFSEDVEVYLNYLRIFNRELLAEGINSRLPAIQNQIYYTGVRFESYQPNSEEIADLTKVLKSENPSEIATFLAQNIRDETSTTMICSLDETKIYKTINLAVSDITGSYIDIENFSGSSEQFQNTANELQEIRKEIISSELKELLVKILNKEKFKIDFDENKITEIKEKIENKLRDKGLLPSRETIPTLAQNASQPSISASLIPS